MVELFLVRHGECSGSGNYIGRGSDVTLTEEGIEQIKKLSSFLRENQDDNPIDLIFSSPMIRCQESSAIISKDLDIQVETLPGMEEIDFGDWEGLAADYIKETEEDRFNQWIENPVLRKPENGETLVELKERVLNSFSPIQEKINDDKKWRIVLVSHRGPIAVIITELLGMDLTSFWNFRIDRGSLSVLNLYPQFSELALLNRMF
ncbi:MAG: histidine phosphatase family protein [Deltaproteobacteria bacterium]|nr:histidine phosphatase family protein [Deltaproteobacteria bacterium]